MGNQYNKLYNQNKNNENNNSENNNSPPPNIVNDNQNQNVINEENNNNQINDGNQNQNENKINEEKNEENKNNENNENNENNNIQENNNGEAPPNSENSDCPVPANIKDYEKNFSFGGLMSKIKDTAKKAGLKAIYMALLLYYALESPTITVMDKAIIYGALGYFITPIDIVPDILPLIGLTDDIAVLAWAFSRVRHNVTDMTREKAKTKLKIWFGEFDEKEIDDL